MLEGVLSPGAGPSESAGPVAVSYRNINPFNPPGTSKMKTPSLVAAIVACALSSGPAASAQDNAPPGKPAMSMDMGQQMSTMQANMKDMQAQMEKIRATTDPKERRKLMEAHMQAMQECMATMREQDKPMMTMGGDQAGGMAMGGDMMKHRQMMEGRMGMMEMMMEQMLQHMQMMQSVPSK